jgi:hypothetical protein
VLPDRPIGNDGDLHILREIHDLLNESFRQPASQRSLLLPKDEDLRDLLLPRERHERFRKIRPFQHARLYLERLGKAEMTLKSIAIVVAEMPQIGRRPDVYAKAIGAQVVRHAATPANQRGAGRIRFDHEEQALARFC